MLNIVPSNQFKKDLKLAKKRGLKLERLAVVYRVEHEELELFLFRTGTHADLF